MTPQYLSRVALGSFALGTFVSSCASDQAAPGYSNPSETSESKLSTAESVESERSPTQVVTHSQNTTPDTAPIGETAASSVTRSEPPTPADSFVEETSAGGGSTAGGTAQTPDVNCDLTGRWLVTQHTVEEGLGAQQAVRQWMYFEFAQDGSHVVATRGLDCGFDVIPLSAIGGSADLNGAWAEMMKQHPMAGREASVQATAAGCSITFDPYVLVYGATVAHYANTANALPGPDDAASGSTPGWEDWEADSHPGVTYNLSGIASGRVFYATRMTDIWSGQIEGTATSFILGDATAHENSLLGYDGSSLLTTESQLASDAELHFAEFARLDAAQATGDDAATCEAVRELADTLTPTANGN